MAVPSVSSRRAESALTLIGVSESRSNAVAGPASISAASRAGNRCMRLPDGFILPFHPGVKFQYAFVYPGFHAVGPGNAKRFGYGDRLIGMHYAFTIVQGQRFGFQGRFRVAGLPEHYHVTSQSNLIIVLPEAPFIRFDNPRRGALLTENPGPWRVHGGIVGVFKLLYAGAGQRRSEEH